MSIQFPDFGVQGLGFRVYSSGFRVKSLGLGGRAEDLWFTDEGFGFRVKD